MSGMIAMRFVISSGGLVRVLTEQAGETPEQHLRPFRGILQADAFTGYTGCSVQNAKVVR